MSQGQVNDIKNNAQFLGFKNDRGVIPLCYDFPCKFIKIKWGLRRCWLKKLYSSLFSLARPLSKNDTGGQNGPCFCFPQTVICYLLSVPQKNHFWKLSTVNFNAWCWCHWPVPVTFRHFLCQKQDIIEILSHISLFLFIRSVLIAALCFDIAELRKLAQVTFGSCLS